MTFTIAIDGPAASGKGTLARRIAGEYGFHHLDTGLTYRATAKALMDEHRVPVVIEFILERVTNIAMGADINAVVEFEDLAERGEDAPTATLALLD